MKKLRSDIKDRFLFTNFSKYFLTVLVIFGLLLSCNKEETDGFKKKSFSIENSAELQVAVPSEIIGKEILSAWEIQYPNIKLFYHVIDENHLLGFDDNLDLFYGDLKLMALYYDFLLPLDQSFQRISKVKEIAHLSKVINFNEDVFIPFDLTGFVLAYNKGLIEEIDKEFLDNKISFENILELDFEETAQELLAVAFMDF